MRENMTERYMACRALLLGPVTFVHLLGVFRLQNTSATGEKALETNGVSNVPLLLLHTQRKLHLFLHSYDSMLVLKREIIESYHRLVLPRDLGQEGNNERAIF